MKNTMNLLETKKNDLELMLEVACKTIRMLHMQNKSKKQILIETEKYIKTFASDVTKELNFVNTAIQTVKEEEKCTKN